MSTGSSPWPGLAGRSRPGDEGGRTGSCPALLGGGGGTGGRAWFFAVSMLGSRYLSNTLLSLTLYVLWDKNKNNTKINVCFSFALPRLYIHQ